MPNCAVCLEPTSGDADYHANCLERLFGWPLLPLLDIDRSEFYRLAATMAGKMSISGVQEKISLRLSDTGNELVVAATGGRYILKPEPSGLAGLPENEHLTMRLAQIFGIETPPFGLMRLKDGPWAYIIKRFDRLDDGRKLPVEDFCQLSQQPLRDKYSGSAELCARLVRRYASEPLIELRKLYRLLLFSWLVANGDMHLKNFSLLTSPDGLRRLSPAYDLVATRLVLPDDRTLALPMQGKNQKLTRRTWLDFASYCGLPERATERLLHDALTVLDQCVETIERSFLSEKRKRDYEVILRENTAKLARSSRR